MHGFVCIGLNGDTEVVVSFLQESMAQRYQFVVFYHKSDSFRAGQVHDGLETTAVVASLTSDEAL
jgi:hypothetical protein